MKALLLALIVLLFGGSVAYAQPLHDVATYTNWSLANSTNPFTGRKGISHEEAARLPVGTPITLRDGSIHRLKRGEYVWKVNREYARKAPLASRPIHPTTAAKAATPRAEKPKVAEAKPAPVAAAPASQVVAQKSLAKPAAKVVDSYALEQARIQARYEADQETARLAVEANNLRMAAESNLELVSGSTDAAFAADKKGEARKEADFAKNGADSARNNATEAAKVATAAETIAKTTNSARATKNAAAARTDATATAAAAAKANELAKRAATAPDQWVWDFGPLLVVLAVIGSLIAYTVVTALMFRFLPDAFNFVFRTGIESDNYLFLPVKLFALPGFLVGRQFTNETFYKKHYDYLYAADESDDASADDNLIEASETRPVPANDGTIANEGRRFSPYPIEERMELHQVVR